MTRVYKTLYVGYPCSTSGFLTTYRIPWVLKIDLTNCIIFLSMMQSYSVYVLVNNCINLYKVQYSDKLFSHTTQAMIHIQFLNMDLIGTVVLFLIFFAKFQYSLT